MNPADMLANFWNNHEVIIEGVETRTAWGITKTPPQKVMADVSAESRTVTDQNGQEVLVAATVTWHPSGPLPEVGHEITLPPEFGMKPEREIITVRREYSGTGLTPDHIEVTLK